MTVFTGVREPEYFQTGQRHIASLRARNPEPQAFLNAEDARQYGLEDGDWAEVRTEQGGCTVKISIRDMPKGLVRVPHGWWKPETKQGADHLSSAWIHADAQICPDSSDYLDREQGIPHFRGMACSIRKLSTANSFGSTIETGLS